EEGWSLRLRCISRQGGETVGEAVELPCAREGAGLVPRGRLVGQRGKRRGRIHGGDRFVEPQRFRLHRKAAGIDRRLERFVLAQQGGGSLRSDAFGTRE